MGHHRDNCIVVSIVMGHHRDNCMLTSGKLQASFVRSNSNYYYYEENQKTYHVNPQH